MMVVSVHTILCFDMQAISHPEAPHYVLVKCYLSNSEQAQKQIQLIKFPLDDECVSIMELKDKLRAKVCGLLEGSSGGRVKLWNFDLYWCKTICCLDRQLDYFLPLHQPLVFHADITHSEHREGVEITIHVKTLTGKIIILQADSTESIAEVKLKIEAKDGKKHVYVGSAGTIAL